MTNFILVGDPRREMKVLGGALVSPEAPPPPAIAAEPMPLKAWDEPKAPDPAPANQDEPRMLYALVLMSCVGSRPAVEVYETEEKRDAAYLAFLDELREPGEEDVDYAELEERGFCGCGRSEIHLVEARLGGLREMERRVRLKKHFQREKERMEVEEVRCRAP